MLCGIIIQNPTACCDAALLNMALTARLSEDALDLIIRNLPDDLNSVAIHGYWSNSSINGNRNRYTLSQRDAELIAQNLLPKLNRVSFQPRGSFASTHAFQSIVNSLTAVLTSGVGSRLSTVCLDLPFRYLYQSKALRSALETIVTSSTLQHLTLRRSNPKLMVDTAVTHYMEHKVLEMVHSRKVPLDELGLAGFLVDTEPDGERLLTALLSSSHGAKLVELNWFNYSWNLEFPSNNQEISSPFLGDEPSFDKACLENLKVRNWGSNFNLLRAVLRRVVRAPILKRFNMSEYNEAEEDLTKEVLAFLNHSKSLEYLRIRCTTLQAHFPTVFGSLRQTTLRKIYITPLRKEYNYAVDYEPFSLALKLLEASNTTLVEVNFGFLNVAQEWSTDETIRKINYYCHLNRYGRGLARDPRTDVATLVRYVHQAMNQADYGAAAAYGLLRECPSIWATPPSPSLHFASRGSVMEPLDGQPATKRFKVAHGGHS